MKKVNQTAFVLASALLLASCANNSNETKPMTDSVIVKKDSAATSAKANDSATVKAGDSTSVKAKFEITKAGDDKSDIAVDLNGKKTKIATISGEALHYTKSDFAKYQVPKNAIDACGAWFGGQGQYFYLVPTDKGVDLYEGNQAEEVPASEGYHWKKTKSL